MNGVTSQWHQQLDGKLIDQLKCVCLDNAHPELECPIDDHVVKWLQQHIECEGIVSYNGNGSDGKHYWLTPPDLLAALQREFGFDFDPCPYPRPDGFDGLTVEWGSSNYVNPPFIGPTAWARKAIAEYKKGKRVVFVFPIDKWVHLLLEVGATVRNLRDVKWCAIEDGRQGRGTGRHVAAFILDPTHEHTSPKDAV